jgi:hypothetical protein
VTPRQAVRLERPFECTIDQAVEMLEPVTNRASIRFHRITPRMRLTSSRSSSTVAALSDHDGYCGCIVAQMPAGKSRDLVEQAAQHAVSIRRAMSNNRFQKAIVAELEAL